MKLASQLDSLKRSLRNSAEVSERSITRAFRRPLDPGAGLVLTGQNISDPTGDMRVGAYGGIRTRENGELNPIEQNRYGSFDCHQQVTFGHTLRQSLAHRSAFQSSTRLKEPCILILPHGKSEFTEKKLRTLPNSPFFATFFRFFLVFSQKITPRDHPRGEILCTEAFTAVRIPSASAASPSPAPGIRRGR